MALPGETLIRTTDGDLSANDPRIAATIETHSSAVYTDTSNQLVLGTTRTATINAPTPASASRTYTIPDPGAAASFVMTESAQTVNGVKTFGSQPVVPSLKATAATNQIVLGATGHLVTISSPAIAAAAQTVTLPDPLAASTFALIVAAPAAANSTGAAGSIAYDASFFYVCVATNTWLKVAIATW